MSAAAAAGLVGVAAILAAYALLQAGRLRADRALYSALNAAGAGLILFSLVFDFNLPSAVIETVWLALSVWGLVRSGRRRRSR